MNARGLALDPGHRAALLELLERLADADIAWALTGSLGHALQGVPIEVRDIDVQTDEDGAYRIAQLLRDVMVQPVAWRPAASIRSHFGTLRLCGVTVEVMGALQKRLPDGSWEPPVDVSAHRSYADFEGRPVPVLSLEHESRAYETMGRRERADLLRQHAATPLRNPGNAGVLSYLGRNGRRVPLWQAAADVAIDPYLEAGAHPDVVSRVWDELGAALPPESRGLVLGTPALIHGVNGTIVVVALGTTYALRVPRDHWQEAMAVGAKQVHHYSSGSVTLDVSCEFGPDWIFGTWNREEPGWCRGACGAVP